MTGQLLPTVNACWRSIGVRGDGSCPELRVHVHCHNCPVYAEAARILLDRPLPPDLQAGWIGHFASQTVMPEAMVQKSAFLFRVHAEWLALPSECVQEVVDRRPVLSLPHRGNNAVEGLVNIRGELIILVSLASVLSIAHDDAARTEKKQVVFARLLVVGSAKRHIALPVNEVHGILRYTTHDLSDIPSTLAESHSSLSMAILKWRNRPVGLLDADRLLIELDRIVV
jgi:chemotaxis-related protein WspD